MYIHTYIHTCKSTDIYYYQPPPSLLPSFRSSPNRFPHAMYGTPKYSLSHHGTPIAPFQTHDEGPASTELRGTGIGIGIGIGIGTEVTEGECRWVQTPPSPPPLPLSRRIRQRTSNARSICLLSFLSSALL